MPQELLNKDLFLKDPTTSSIPNDGVATVVEPTTSEQWDVLAYELRSFVCKGEYERGLDRVLSTFLGHLDQPKQPAVWVSGFYGSGKSHFARVLEFLWRDPEFPDGERARSKADLPAEIEAHLRELSIHGRRAGGVWSAAGTLSAGAGDAVRLAMLGIVFRSAGLPSQYGRARFLLWLKSEGIFDAYAAEVAQRGKNLDDELQHLYVSPALHDSLLAVRPDFAPSRAAAGGVLRDQFPSPADVGNDDFVEAVDAVLRLQSATEGKRPLALFIFDELQQFIGEDSTRTSHVQEVVETCSARFGSGVLFLGTGQAAMQGNTQLQKLQGRFTVRVMLSDSDVERVVREVVLSKKQSQIPALGWALDQASGEISRHLTETRIGASTADRADLVPDYPLLPTRRRFWEAVLRAVDAAGTAGQLRTQLRIVQEATKAVAREPVGHVVGGDYIFDQLKTDMLQSGTLLRETDEIIADLQKPEHGADGRLRARLYAAIFLIGRDLSYHGSSAGVRATADTLADLLVEDLTAGSGELRRRIPELLKDLVETGRLMLVDDEYRLQTREGMVWEQEFRERSIRILNEDFRIAGDRTQAIKTAVQKALEKIPLVHGVSKTPRKYDLHFGLDLPKSDAANVPVWVRDEWSATERAVREDAIAAGSDSPVVFVFLPRRDADGIRRAIARAAAAEETLNARGTPASDEGSQARAAMQARLTYERERLASLIGETVHAAKVLQGGGNEVADGSLRASVAAAIEAGLSRLFPQFAIGDHPNWGRVVTHALSGAGDALKNVGHEGEVADERVCREVRRYLGGAGKKGKEVRDHFANPPFGWPQDAVDGALLALTSAGLVRAIRGGQPQRVKELTKQQIPQIDFAGEEEIVGKTQWMALRGLVLDVTGTSPKTDDETRASIPLVLQQLVTLAGEAGGDPPAPAQPSTTHLRELQALTGNGQLLAIHDQRARLATDAKSWKTAKTEIGRRLPRWHELQRLMRHGAGVPEIEAVRPQVEAIFANRSLLLDPDAVRPLLDQVTSNLRGAVQAARNGLEEARKREIDHLNQTAEWRQLGDDKWTKILAENGLGFLPTIDVSTDEALLRTLDAAPLADWAEKLVALPQRIANARQQAAKLLEPEAVRVRPGAATLKTPDEVDAYVEGLRGEMMEHVKAGRPVIV